MTTITVMVLLVFIGQQAIGGEAEDDGSYDNAMTIAKALDGSASGRSDCSVRRNTKTVLCIIDATPREAERIADGVVVLTIADDRRLTGWKLMIVTLSDHVATRRF